MRWHARHDHIQLRKGSITVGGMPAQNLWTESQVKRALFLYFQTPFGKMHSGNPEIKALAAELGRTPSAVAMKLTNLASLDPEITNSGRKGLAGASALDRRVWDEFHGDWTRLVVEASSPTDATASNEVGSLSPSTMPLDYEPPGGATTKPVEIEQRVGQNFFRRAVMANFDNSCCVTGIADPRLLNASHISPWGTDVENRHNPRNGLCLSATFDRAFDRCLMTVTPDFKVRLSKQLLRSQSAETSAFFAPYEGRALRKATHLAPDEALLRRHNERLLD